MDLFGINYLEVIGISCIFGLFGFILSVSVITGYPHSVKSAMLGGGLGGLVFAAFAFVTILALGQNAPDDAYCRNFIVAANPELLETKVDGDYIEVKYEGEVFFNRAIRRRSVQALKNIKNAKETTDQATKNAKILEVIETSLGKGVN